MGSFSLYFFDRYSHSWQIYVVAVNGAREPTDYADRE